MSGAEEFWDRWSRPVTIHLPLHSVTLFLWGISLARNFELFPAFLVFAMGWFLLATMELARNRPSSLYQPRSYAELLNILVLNRSQGQQTIESNEDLEEVRAYERKRAELKRAREEIVKTVEMERKKYETYIQVETSKLEEELDITTQVKGGLPSLTLAPLRGILLPLQQFLHVTCVILRVVNSIVVWRDSVVAFWLTTACFLAAFILIWIPWGFIIGWTFKIAAWVFLGPWMKLLDIFYVKRKVAEEKEQRKEDLAEQFHRRYALLIGESLARKLRKESALKMKEMKKYMFGQFLMRVPVYKEEPFFDDPLPESFAEPFDGPKFGDIRVIDRKYGQLLKGDMIPERYDNFCGCVDNCIALILLTDFATRQIPVPAQRDDYVAGSPDHNLSIFTTFQKSLQANESEPLLPILNEDYGSTNISLTKKT
jgi:hypothetical protein